MDAHDCPTADQLEAFVRGESVDDAVGTHVESCEACQRAIEEICTNNMFLKEFAGVQAAGGDGDREREPPPPSVLPGYKIEGEIYRGGQGIVYRATQIRTKRPVAVKMLLRGSLATTRQRLRFEREAEIVAALRHPGIVTVYDAGYLPDGRFGFAMELVEGVTLDRWSGDSMVTSKDELALRLRLFVAICDAASFAHQHGVIHRDLNPANILVDAQGMPHILDFGIAKAFESDAVAPLIFGGSEAQAASDKANAHQTLPGEFAGTPAYASPEQVSGDPRAIDTRTDVYSLGVILYQLMTGRLPYSVEGSLHEVVERITHHKPAPPSAEVPVLDDDIDAIVLRALHKDKERRYASVADLARDIELFLEGRPIETRRDSAWYVVRKTVRRHWVVTSSVAAAVLVLAVFSIAMTLLYNQKTAAETETRQQLRRLSVEYGRAEGHSGAGAVGLDLLWRAQLVPGPGTSPPSARRFGNAFEPLDSYWALWEFYSKNPCIRATEIADNAFGDGVVSPDGALLATVGLARCNSGRCRNCACVPRFLSMTRSRAWLSRAMGGYSMFSHRAESCNGTLRKGHSSASTLWSCPWKETVVRLPPVAPLCITPPRLPTGNRARSGFSDRPILQKRSISVRGSVPDTRGSTPTARCWYRYSVSTPATTPRTRRSASGRCPRAFSSQGRNSTAAFQASSLRPTTGPWYGQTRR